MKARRKLEMTKQQTISPGKTEVGESPERLQEKIRQRAYELYELRGKEDGRDLEDWLKAELEVAGGDDYK
jgi:hypothetical protein